MIPVRDPVTGKLLFKYDPTTMRIEIVQHGRKAKPVIIQLTKDGAYALPPDKLPVS